MKLWAEFYDFVLPHVPGAPTSLVDLHLREASIEFFERTQAWRYDHAPITVVANTANYSFVPPDASTEVHVINYAEFDDKEIGTEVSEFSTRYSDWRNLVSQPEFVIANQTDAILVPIPSLGGTLDLKVSLKPTPIATGIFEDKQFNDYRTTIIAGTLARLMMMPKKPYTDEKIAMLHDAKFSAGITAANVRVDLEYTNAPIQTRIRNYRQREVRRRLDRDF